MNIEKLLITGEYSIIDAMKLMDESGSKILFVTESGKVRAALTDGDIRRWILKNGELTASVSNAANYSPLYLRESQKSEAYNLMRTKKIECVPILDENDYLSGVVFWNEEEYGTLSEKRKLNLPVVMMAGGMGTRLYPYTNVLPKPLIPVGELPIAEHIINQFVEFGCNSFYLVVNFKKNMIKAYFGETEHDYSIDYAEENEPLGTGGGLSLLKGKINETFILTNCDILIREDFNKIYEQHKKSGNLITMICSAKDFKIPYGIVEIDDDGEIKELREKPSLSFLTNTGCYIVEPQVINELEDNTRIGFPDVIDKYRTQGYKVGVYPISESSWLDMGQLDELERMRLKLQD